MRYDEMIERFLRNEIDANEKRHFKVLIKTNPIFKLYAETISALVYRVKKKNREGDETIKQEAESTKGDAREESRVKK